MAPKHHPIKLRRALAAQRMAWIRKGRTRGPVFLLELAEEAHRRMASRERGRPSAGDWDVRRLVPFRRDTWHALKVFAVRIGVTPAQIAALLIEKGLHRLRTEPSMGRIPELTHPPGGLQT